MRQRKCSFLCSVLKNVSFIKIATMLSYFLLKNLFCDASALRIKDHLLKNILLIFQGELLLELDYSDPRDSKLYTEPGADPADNDNLIYKLYVGGEYYYCRPYRHNYHRVRAVSGEN